MGIRSRGLVFATFFGNCIIVGLLVASLTTDHWIISHANNNQNPNATGTIHFGLFSGKQILDKGLGGRPNDIDVRARMNSEPNFMSSWLWLGAFLGTGFALFSSALAAVASVLKSASEAKRHGTMVLLFVSNSSTGMSKSIGTKPHFDCRNKCFDDFVFFSAIAQIIAFVCWVAQFYQYLIHNVLTAEDLQNHWHTKNLSSLGHSFYLLVIGIIIVTVNLIILCMVVSMERKERRPIRREDPVDEKMVGAIMLY